MKFSFLSWNVEHFRGDGERVQRVAAHIRDQRPDIFGLLEIEGADILQLMDAEFSDFDFSVTDGPQQQEILVGWRRDKFDQVIFTQKREFKAYNPRLRPGALLTVKLDATFYNLLFLHTDSGPDAPAFGNRAEMFDKVWALKNALDKKAGGPGQARLIVLGDLNTMGLSFPRRVKKDLRVSEAQEIEALREFAERTGMRPLSKEYEATFASAKYISALDHVLATQNLQFVQHPRPDGTRYEVKVRGWNQLSGAARRKFLEEISDHAALVAEVK